MAPSKGGGHFLQLGTDAFYQATLPVIHIRGSYPHTPFSLLSLLKMPKPIHNLLILLPYLVKPTLISWHNIMTTINQESQPECYVPNHDYRWSTMNILVLYIQSILKTIPRHFFAWTPDPHSPHFQLPSRSDDNTHMSTKPAVLKKKLVFWIERSRVVYFYLSHSYCSIGNKGLTCEPTKYSWIWSKTGIGEFSLKKETPLSKCSTVKKYIFNKSSPLRLIKK